MEPTFSKRKEKAKSLWKGKKGKPEGKVAFDEVRSTLQGMCVGVNICNYCEQCAALDIEHIISAGFFPLTVFAWKNYLLACKNCNTGFKLDRCWVFDPKDGMTPILCQRGQRPPSKEYVFLHPRMEDPMCFIQLDFSNFEYVPKFPKGSRDYWKAKKTLDILKLNDRADLKEYRRIAFGNYKNRLKEYCKVLKANNHQELEDATDGHPKIDLLKSISIEKTRILNAIKWDILNDIHPTVFREMQRGVKELAPALQTYFQQSGALTW